MIERRCRHKSVVVKNKLYAIGGYLSPNCEVFDSTSNKFVMLNQPTESLARLLIKPGELVSIGGELNAFTNKRHVSIYDVKSDKWKGKSCQATQRIMSFSCAKVSRFF